MFWDQCSYWWNRNAAPEMLCTHPSPSSNFQSGRHLRLKHWQYSLKNYAFVGHVLFTCNVCVCLKLHEWVLWQQVMVNFMFTFDGKDQRKTQTQTVTVTKALTLSVWSWQNRMHIRCLDLRTDMLQFRDQSCCLYLKLHPVNHQNSCWVSRRKVDPWVL